MVTGYIDISWLCWTSPSLAHEIILLFCHTGTCRCHIKLHLHVRNSKQTHKTPAWNVDASLVGIRTYIYVYVRTPVARTYVHVHCTYSYSYRSYLINSVRSGAADPWQWQVTLTVWSLGERYLETTHSAITIANAVSLCYTDTLTDI